MKTNAAVICMLFFLLFTGADCDIATNPLIFDGAPAVWVFKVVTDTTHYSAEEEIDLADVLKDIDEDIERISIFNMTIEIDSLKNTSPSVTIAGSMSVNDRILITMNPTPLSAFAQERSVFDPALTTVSVNSATVEYLRTILNSGIPPLVIGRAMGTGSVQEMEFRARLRIYTQVHANL